MSPRTGFAVLVLLLNLAGVSPVHAQRDWIALSAGGLTLRAPAGTHIESAPGIDSRGWRVTNPRFVVTLRLGPSIGDYDDGEPSRCFTPENVVVGGRRAALRAGKTFPRLDCPERYASLYLAAGRPQGDALFLSAQGESQDDLNLVRAILPTIKLPHR